MFCRWCYRETCQLLCYQCTLKDEDQPLQLKAACALALLEPFYTAADHFDVGQTMPLFPELIPFALRNDFAYPYKTSKIENHARQALLKSLEVMPPYSENQIEALLSEGSNASLHKGLLVYFYLYFQ